MDKGKEEPSKSLQGSNSYKKQDMDTTSTDQEEDDQMEQQPGTKTTAEFQKMESMPTAAGNKESEGTEATIDIEGLDETEDTEELDGTETEYTEESEQEETILSPKESSTNNPKGMKMNVEHAAENINQDEQLLSPKESWTNHPKGMKKKRVREEEEDKEDKEKKSKGDSSYADTCTSKFPTSLDLDDKGESMRSPPGDQGYSSHRKNL